MDAGASDLVYSSVFSFAFHPCGLFRVRDLDGSGIAVVSELSFVVFSRPSLSLRTCFYWFGFVEPGSGSNFGYRVQDVFRGSSLHGSGFAGGYPFLRSRLTR